MTIGGEELVRKYRSALAVAEALLEGKLNGFEQQYVEDVVNNIILEAAKFRVLNKINDKKISSEKENDLEVRLQKANGPGKIATAEEIAFVTCCEEMEKENY